MLITLAVAAILSVSLLGYGYASGYIGTTESASNDYHVKYVVIELDGNIAESYTNTFRFPAPEYYTDTVIDSNGTSMTYRIPAYSETSDPRVEIGVIGSNTTYYNLNVKLETSTMPAGSSISLRFYSDSACTVSYGDPMTLTAAGAYVSSGSTPLDMICGTSYYCKATLSVPGGTQSSMPQQITINIRFTANAVTE